jgi:hypothetical protein
MKKSSLISLLSVVLLFLSLPAWGANVALFADNNYVDYNLGDFTAEASNVEATLVSLGHTVNTFTGTSQAAWSNALSGADALVIIV